MYFAACDGLTHFYRIELWPLGLGSLETVVEGGDAYPVMWPEQGQGMGCGCEGSREKNWAKHFLLVDCRKEMLKKLLKSQYLRRSRYCHVTDPSCGKCVENHWWHSWLAIKTPSRVRWYRTNTDICVNHLRSQWSIFVRVRNCTQISGTQEKH